MTLTKTTRWLAICTFTLLPMTPGGAFGKGGGKEVPTRDQIPDKYKWDLTDIYANQQAWEADFTKVEGMIDRLRKLEGTLSVSPQNLLQALQLRDQIGTMISRLVLYAHQSSHLDVGDSKMRAIADRSSTLNVKFGEATAWMEPELLEIPQETVLSWCQSDEHLKMYDHHIRNLIRQKKYTLSAREEELLAMAGKLASAPSDAYTVLNNAELTWPMVRDEEGEEVRLSHARFNKFTYSRNRDVRREAFMGQMQAYKQLENTMAALLNGAVQRYLYKAKARGFDTTLEASLFPSNIPVSVFKNLIKTIQDN
ncbi:MAG: hypothetical protein JSV78_00940, partial [Phycisphaerales bacterium]